MSHPVITLTHAAEHVETLRRVAERSRALRSRDAQSSLSDPDSVPTALQGLLRFLFALFARS